MALYISAGRRRRRLVGTAAVTAILGLFVGLLVGRSTVTTPGERARSVAASGRDLATRIDALTIEYEQAISGTGDSVSKGVSVPLVGIKKDLRAVLDGAPWIGTATRASLIAKVDELRTDATSGMSPNSFDVATADTSKLIRSTLGAT